MSAKPNKIRTKLLLPAILVLCLVCSAFAGPPALFGSLKPGEYSVGVKMIKTWDYQRTYKDKYDSTGNIVKQRARPMTVTIWYPAKKGTGKPTTLKTYLTDGSDGRLNAPGETAPRALTEFKEDLQLPFVLGLKNIDNSLFEKAFAEKMLANLDAVPVKNNMPVIIGTSEAYFHAVTCEYLASHGYTVAFVSAPYGNEQPADSKLYEGPTKDVEWLYSYLYQPYHLETRKVGLFGFGGGGQAPFYFAMKNKEADAMVNLEGGIFGPRSNSTVAESYSPAKFTTPLLHVFIKNGNDDSPEQLQAISHSKRYLVACTSNQIRHHDFTMLGRVALLSMKLREDETEEIERSFNAVHKKMLAFYDDYLKKVPSDLSKAEPGIFDVTVIN